MKRWQKVQGAPKFPSKSINLFYLDTIFWGTGTHRFLGKVCEFDVNPVAAGSKVSDFWHFSDWFSLYFFGEIPGFEHVAPVTLISTVWVCL
jgi:hypothetical protein